jgi:phosphate/sulfate permease
MKKLIIPALVGFTFMTLLTGCIGLSIGSGTTSKPVTATVGQQLVDLQKARDTGAITETEYQALKTKLLNQK